jgi:hypothetical protein
MLFFTPTMGRTSKSLSGRREYGAKSLEIKKIAYG